MDLEDEQYAGASSYIHAVIDSGISVTTKPCRVFSISFKAGPTGFTHFVSLINGTLSTDTVYVKEYTVQPDSSKTVSYGAHGLYFPSGLFLLNGQFTIRSVVAYRIEN